MARRRTGVAARDLSQAKGVRQTPGATGCSSARAYSAIPCGRYFGNDFMFVERPDEYATSAPERAADCSHGWSVVRRKGPRRNELGSAVVRGLRVERPIAA